MRRSANRVIALFLATVLCSTVSGADRESVLAPGGTPILPQERGAGEGPAWRPELGLLASGEGHVMRRSREGEVSVYLENAGSNGLLFD